MMCCGRLLRVGLTAAVLAGAAAGAHAQATAEAAATPFQGLHGDWSGTGSITLGSGDRERIRCRVNYDVHESGNSLQQDLRCASDSYKFDMMSNVNIKNSQLSGHWTEHTRNKSGTLSGRAVPGRIEALAEAAGFSAFFTMITRGDRQTFKIESKNPDIQDISIALRKSAN
jgi:hypothetical protein